MRAAIWNGPGSMDVGTAPDAVCPEDGVLLHAEPPGDSLETLDGRGEELAHGLAEVGILPMLGEGRQQEAQPEGHVPHVVRQDPVEGRTKAGRSAGSFVGHPLPRRGYLVPDRRKRTFTATPGRRTVRAGSRRTRTTT